MLVSVHAVGLVETARTSPEDDFWGNEEACIVLDDRFRAESLQSITEFSHAEVLFLFHQVDPARVVAGARHPRNNPGWPSVGIFAQRAKKRPNRLGSTICRILRVQGSRLYVAELDAIDGTPVLDIKPVMASSSPGNPFVSHHGPVNSCVSTGHANRRSHPVPGQKQICFAGRSVRRWRLPLTRRCIG